MPPTSSLQLARAQNTKHLIVSQDTHRPQEANDSYLSYLKGIQ